MITGSPAGKRSKMTSDAYNTELLASFAIAGSPSGKRPFITHLA